jgi:tetratricopeptide (TPR) repeat protein
LVELTRQKVVEAPRSAARWGRLGMVLRAHAFAGESNFCFEQAERLDPQEPRWPYYRGLTTVQTDPAAGLACLRRAVERLGDGPLGPRFRLVEVLLEQGELEEAASQLDLVRQRDPAHPRGRLLQARLACARQDWKGALAGLEGCWDDRHTRRQAHRLAALAWQRLGEPGRAGQMLARAKEGPEDVPWADPLVEEVDRLTVGLQPRLNHALVLERQGQVDEAIGLLQQLVRERPREATAWALLGQVHRRQNQLVPAEQALARAVEVDGGNVEGWFYLGVVRVFLGRKHQAAAAFREAIRLKPDHALAHYNLGICLKDAGDRDGARRALQEALRCQPDDALARKALADLAPGSK